MFVTTRIELRCSECDAELEAEEQPNGIVTIEPHSCKTNNPVRMYYDDLVDFLDGELVSVTYLKKNGEVRDLEGYLGRLNEDKKTIFFVENNVGLKLLYLKNVGNIELVKTGSMFNLILDVENV